MPSLPTNIVRLRTLRRGVALKLLAVPYVSGLTAMALWPKGQNVLPVGFPSHLGGLLGVAPEHVESFAGAMVVVVLLFLGYLLGWAINAAVLAISSSYGASQAFQIIGKSKLPASWQNEKAQEIIATTKTQLAEQRANAIAVGRFRFIVVRGGLIFGTVAFVLLHIVLTLLQSQPIVWQSLPWKFLLWLALGTANAAWSWHELTRVTPPEA